MMEFLSERERYLSNPLRLLRCLADIAMRPVVAVDEALAEFNDARVFNPLNYPGITYTEAPVATEEELLS
jgi:hypothetical protein